MVLYIVARENRRKKQKKSLDWKEGDEIIPVSKSHDLTVKPKDPINTFLELIN